MGQDLLEAVDEHTKALNNRLNGPSQENGTEPASLVTDTIYAPTHILALPIPISEDNAQSEPSTNFIFQPTHSLVLASHCRNLPDLSSSTSSTVSDEAIRAVQLDLPHPTLFPPLHRYFYNHNDEELFRFFLLPSDYGENPASSDACQPPPPRDIHIEYLLHRIIHSPSLNLATTLALRLSLILSRRALVAKLAMLHRFQMNLDTMGVHEEQISSTIITISRILRATLRVQHTRYYQQYRRVREDSS
ncbi:hypothetical protein CPB86DRAFT_818641 [Serendipita vermifera]|nr:hypothetical protein CPB86DRAFT_818641 [Serendipita vermifera]